MEVLIASPEQKAIDLKQAKKHITVFLKDRHGKKSSKMNLKCKSAEKK